MGLYRPIKGDRKKEETNDGRRQVDRKGETGKAKQTGRR